MSWPRFWTQNNWQTKLLLPLSQLVCWEASRRYRRFLKVTSHSRQRQTAATLIVVGNIVVGGTGKTPFIVWLVSQLKQKGYRVAILSRGYGAKKSHWPKLVERNSNPQEAGDEPVMLAQQTGCLVGVSPQRVEALALLNQQNTEFDFIVSDDGLQHFALQRDIEIVMIDSERQFGNKHCLPAGPLREPMARISEVDFTVWNGLEQTQSFPDLALTPRASYKMQLQAWRFCCVAHPEKTLSIEEFKKRYALDEVSSQAGSSSKGQRVPSCYAVAGIGNPQRFFNSLSQLGINAENKAFSDHHLFSVDDFKGFIEDASKPLIMTQKDAVKCAQFATSAHNWWYLEVAPQCDEALLENIIDKHVRRLNS